jgi:hypothetical protein
MFLVALLRTMVVAGPALVAAHALRRRLAVARGVLGLVLELVLALSWLLVVGELLGLVGALRFGWLAVTVAASAGVDGRWPIGAWRGSPAASSRWSRRSGGWRRPTPWAGG